MSDLYERIKHALRSTALSLPDAPTKGDPLPADWLNSGDLGRAKDGPVDRGAFVAIEVGATESPRKIVAALEDYGFILLDMAGLKYLPVYGGNYGFGGRYLVYILSEDGVRYVNETRDKMWEKK